MVMAQPQLAMLARAMESTNAPRATRVLKMQGKSALSAMRTLVEHAACSIATVGVMPRVRTIDASALLELAVSMESAKHLLIAKKPRTLRALSPRAVLVNVWVLRQIDIADAPWISVLWETAAWAPTFYPCN